jgi:hypothetical protein
MMARDAVMVRKDVASNVSSEIYRYSFITASMVEYSWLPSFTST